MSLPLDTTLHRIGQALAARVAPALDDEYAGETLRLAGLLLTICANAADDAVALRVDENAEMRALFADAVVADADLAAQLDDAARSRDVGLRLSELDPENDRLRRLLIDLHAHLEEQDGDAGSGATQRIWRMLEAFAARRAPQV